MNPGCNCIGNSQIYFQERIMDQRVQTSWILLDNVQFISKTLTSSMYGFILPDIVTPACNPSTWVLRQEDRGRKFEAILVWTIRPCLKQTIILVLILRKHWYCQSWLFCFWVFVCLFCFVHNGTGLITSLVALVSISLVINELSTFP
jgi:hypothetical protein